MRILGIDYGKKRMGLAISDPLGLTAQGLGVISCEQPEEFLERISQLIEEKEVKEIVVGLPKRMDSSLGEEAQAVLRFAETLRLRTGLPVHLVDERLTTARAHKILKGVGLSRKERTQKADVVAAQTILQIFLDKRSKSREGENNTQAG